MKSILGLVAAVVCTMSVSAAEISTVIVRQQWPWSTSVRVEYVLTGVTSPVDIVVEVSDGDTPLDSETLASSLSGDVYGMTRNGAYVLEIDPVKAFGASRSVIADFKVTLSTRDSSAEMLEVMYKIFDLTKQSSVTDVRRADLLNGTYGAIETDYGNIIPGSPVEECLIWTDVTNKPIYKTTHLVMRKIAAAGKSFVMGAPSSELGQAYGASNYGGYEKQHTVSFTNDFYIAVFPTTKYQHKLIVGETPESDDVASRTPVQGVLFCELRGRFCNTGILGWWPDAGTWDGDTFIPDPNGSPRNVEGNDGRVNALHKLRVKTGVDTFDLPTEARWEYCCRAGTTSATYAGDLTVQDYTELDPVVDKIGWCAQNSGGSVKEVGLKAVNPWGLYDMIGNVYELCLDIKKSDMSSSAVVDPVGDSSSNRYIPRLGRGCGVENRNSYHYRSAFRGKTFTPHEYENGNDLAGYRLMFDVR